MIIDSVLSRQVKAGKSVDESKQSEEKIKRSLAKTISWRVIGTLDTLLLSWLITGEATLAFTIASVEFASKMVLYFFHERAWNNIKWGK
ncbi:DUF2061 domain-containing protein [Changchengzhania lutea]|uniref:DUF2061 domain-containing protein n=1 Tax=Changchengzhania lutea TaxID=2049305 RepID=UPI00115E8537|nr:DUF2061 domain-containing protein [Changchengzhania lutea]